MRAIIILTLLSMVAGAWELTIDASCSACGFYQKGIVIKPGMAMAPCQVCSRIITKFRNTSIGSGECKECGSWVQFYPEYLCKLSWWQVSEGNGEPRRSSPAIYICPVCGGLNLNFVCTKRKI